MIKDIFDIIVSFSGIVISCVALYISIKTDKKQYNLDLLEQRFEIYSVCQKFITYILLNNNCTLEELQSLKLGTIKAKFLFGENVLEYIEELYCCGRELLNLKDNIPKKMKVIDKVETLREGIEFKKYLKIL